MRRRLIRSAQVVAMIVVSMAAYWYSGIGLPAAVERLLIGTRPPIVIGLLHSATGAQAISEHWLREAEVMAIDEINARGGVDGRRVVFVEKDARSDPATAASLARAMIAEDGAVAIFGCWTSEGRKAVQAVVEEAGALLFFPGNYEGIEASRRTIYMGGASNQSVIPAVRWCHDSLKARRFFVVGSEEIWSRASSEIAKDAARAAGGEVVGEAYLPLAGGGEAAAVAAVRAAKPDVVVNLIVGSPVEAFLAAMKQAGLPPDRMPSIGFAFSEGEMKRFTPADVAGHYAGTAYFQTIDRPESRDFVRRLQARAGGDRPASDPIVAAYNGVILWAQAASEAGSAEPDVVLAHIDRQSLDAPEGVITVDPLTRVAWRPFHVGRARPDGQFDVVFSFLKPIRPSAFVGTRTIGQWRSTVEGFRAGWGGRWSSPASVPAPAPAPAPAPTTTTRAEEGAKP